MRWVTRPQRVTYRNESGVTYRTISHAGDATHTEYCMRVTQRTQNIAVRVTERTLNIACGWRNAHWITEYRSAGDVTQVRYVTRKVRFSHHRGWRHAPHTFFFIFLYYIFFFWNFKNLWIFLMLRNIIEYIRGKL